MSLAWLSDEETLTQIRRALSQERGYPALLQEVVGLVLLHQYGWTCRWLAQAGMQVRGGPLAGLKYLPTSAGSVLPAKLVGSYECELHPTLERIIAAPYTRMVNVGCAEGYYAVGLAWRMPRLYVHAFDTDARERALCQQMAEVNGVADRVLFGETCDHVRLQELATPRTLIICDIEGAEMDLLDPVQVPALAGCDLLVECHDFLGHSISTELAERFRPTHEVEVIGNTWTNPNEWSFLLGLRPIQKFLAVWEGRPGLTPWLFLTSRKTDGNGEAP